MSQNPSTYVTGIGLPTKMPGSVPPYVGVPQQGTPSDASNFSFNESAQLGKINQSLKPNNKAEVVQELEGVSAAQPAQTSNLSSASSTPIISAPTGVPLPPSYQVLPGFGNIPATSPPGISPPVPFPANMTVMPSSDFSTAFLRPNHQSMPVLSNPPIQHQGYAPYPSVSPAAASARGPWLQPPQVSGLLRPPFSAYPVAMTGPFPLPARSTPIPSVPLPDTEPPGVTNVGAPSATPMHTVGSTSQPTAGVLQAEIPSGTDIAKSANAVDIKDGSPVSEQLEVWTAHRTETGALYYYNAVTGESTYEKPSGFVGEPEKVTAQPTPVSWDKLAGTDWTLVTTNDGKKYYYNTKTKLSSWQIPSEVTELKKKQDADALRTSMYSNVLTENGSPPGTLSAPAITTGGRDATVLRSSSVVGHSSALDLVKRKLQDSGVPPATSPGAVSSELNCSKLVEARDSRSDNSKENVKETNGESNLSDTSSDSEDDDNGPRKEECILKFKEMLKERDVAPFSKWEKELPKIFFDPRFKAIPSHSARRALFEHYVRTRAEEQRKEKRAAQKAAVEGFRKLLEEAKEDIDDQTDYQTFKKKWGHDPRFEALDRKEREALLNERILPLKKAAEEKAQAMRAAAISSFKSLLKEAKITLNSRWSKVKDSLRNDPRYKSVKHDARESLFNEYIIELRAAEEEAERISKDKNSEEEKLKERERALRKRKEREEQEVERVRLKARRKEAVESYQALLVESIKDPQASWTESKPKLEKDPQGRAANPHLDQSDLEKLFREHVKILHERCVSEFRALLADVITLEAAAQEKDGKTVLTSWSTAKHHLKSDARYTKMPRKDRESLWKRHVEDIHRRQKLASDRETEKHKDVRNKSSDESGKNVSGSRTHDRR